MTSLNPFKKDYRFGNITKYIVGIKLQEDDLTDEQRSQREIYREHKRRFRDALEIVLSGDTVTQEQIENLWETSKPLKAEHAAKIMTKCLQANSSNSVYTDKPHAAEKFRTVFKMLLAGNMVTTKQMEMISQASSNLTGETITRICQEEVTIAYQKKQAAVEAARKKESEFCAKFTEVLRVAIDSESLSDDMFFLLVNASQTLPPAEVDAVMRRLNTSWEDLHTKHQNRRSPTSPAANIPLQAAVAAPIPPPPPPRRLSAPGSPASSAPPPPPPPRRLSAGLMEGIAKPPSLRKTSDLPADANNNTTTTNLEPVRRCSLPGSVLADITAGKASLRQPKEAENANPVRKSQSFSSIVAQLAEMMEGRRIYTEPEEKEIPDSDDEGW